MNGMQSTEAQSGRYQIIPISTACVYARLRDDVDMPAICTFCTSRC